MRYLPSNETRRNVLQYNGGTCGADETQDRLNKRSSVSRYVITGCSSILGIEDSREEEVQEEQESNSGFSHERIARKVMRRARPVVVVNSHEGMHEVAKHISIDNILTAIGIGEHDENSIVSDFACQSVMPEWHVHSLGHEDVASSAVKIPNQASMPCRFRSRRGLNTVSAEYANDLAGDTGSFAVGLYLMLNAALSSCDSRSSASRLRGITNGFGSTINERCGTSTWTVDDDSLKPTGDCDHQESRLVRQNTMEIKLPSPDHVTLLNALDEYWLYRSRLPVQKDSTQAWLVRVDLEKQWVLDQCMSYSEENLRHGAAGKIPLIFLDEFDVLTDNTQRSLPRDHQAPKALSTHPPKRSLIVRVQTDTDGCLEPADNQQPTARRQDLKSFDGWRARIGSVRELFDELAALFPNTALDVQTKIDFSLRKNVRMFIVQIKHDKRLRAVCQRVEWISLLPQEKGDESCIECTSGDSIAFYPLVKGKRVLRFQEKMITVRVIAELIWTNLKPLHRQAYMSLLERDAQDADESDAKKDFVYIATAMCLNVKDALSESECVRLRFVEQLWQLTSKEDGTPQEELLPVQLSLVHHKKSSQVTLIQR